MSQPPKTNGCHIFDEDGNVRVDDEGRVVAHSDGRRTVVYNKNGSRLHDTIAINVHAWKVAAGLVGALSSIIVTTWLAVVWVGGPRFREYQRELDQPIVDAVTIQEKRMDRHELELAKTYPLYYTKLDIDKKFDAEVERIDRDINKITIEIDNLRKGRR